MASLPDGITLDIPDLRVTITPRSDYIVTIQPVDEYHVVTFDTPTVTRATSIFVDYAQSASYANNVASSSYAEVSATSSYADNFNVAGVVTASTFFGDGSLLTGVTAIGTGVEIRDDGVLSGISQILDFTDGIDVSFVSSTSSISINRTGSFQSSSYADYAVSASFATTASYVEGAASDWNTLTNKPAGLVSSSAQINTGSFSGSFIGNGSGLTGLVSASHALNADDAISSSYSITASYADTAQTASFVTASRAIIGELTASGLNYPSADGDAYQLFRTDGGGNITLEYADRLTLDVKNTSGGPLNKGIPVHITGFQGDGIYQIEAADSSDTTKMPAVGILAETLADNDIGHAVLYGAFRGIDTLSYSVGDELFVGVGELTGSAPQYPSLIQKIASVGNSANNGEITILGAGRSNAVSNLGSGQIFYGVDDRPTTQSLASILSGNAFSYSGSFIGDGSGLTDIVSASFATTASYVEGAASDWNTLTNKPAGLVSSSAQINTGSFSGSFTGDGSGLTGLVSASHALNADNVISASYSVTASYADNAGVSDWNELTNVPSGLVSSSTQTIANISGQEITPSIISSSGHIVPSTTEIYDLGSTDLRWRDLYLSGSTIYLGNAQLSSIGQLLSGSFTGSFSGDASSITGVISSSHAITASYADNAGASDWSELTNIPSGLVSSSGQVDHDQTTNYDANEHFTQANITTVGTVTSGDVSTILPTGTVSSSAQVDYDSIQNVPSGLVSASSQVDYVGLTNIPSGIVSSSGQVDYTGLSNIPAGIVSSSQQINTGSFTGSFTGEFTGDGSGLTGVTGVGSGVEIRDDGAIQGTAQILDFVDGIDATFASSTASISLNRTGSFTGSFSGDGSGLTSLTTDTATSADTASYLNPLQQLVRITGSVEVAQGNLILDDNAYFLYGTNTSEQSISLIGVTSGDIVEVGNQGIDIKMVDDVIVDGFVSASSHMSASTFSGDGSNLTGIDTDQVTEATNLYYTDARVKTKLDADGVFSSSAQVDYDSIQNVPSGIVSSSAFSSPSQGTVRATINGVQTDVDTGLQTGDSPQFTNLTLSGNLTVNGTTTYISSSQVDIGDQIITLNANNAAGDGGIYVNDTSTNETGSLLWDVSENYWIGGLLGSESELITLTSLNAKGVISSSGQVDYTGLSNVPSGIVSSSTQVDYDSIQNVPIGIVSSSAQVDHDQTANYDANEHFTQANITTVGTVTSGDVSAILPAGTVSSSGQVDYDSIQNVPSGIISSSTQFTDITAPFTGSFTGSFVGDGTGLTGLVSSSYADTAATASYFSGSINFPDGLSVTGSFELQGSMSASGDVTASAFVGDGSNITGVVSSSYALTASYAANGGGGGGVTINNNTDNYLVTATGTADTLNGEQNLQFDGSKLTVTGDISASGDVTASAFVGDGSNITGVISSSYALTASYAANGGGGGGVTSITAGAGLNGGTITDSGTISVDSGSILPYYSESIFSTVSGDATITSAGVISVISSSHAIAADSASYMDGLISFPNGLDVTGSLLVDGDISASGDVTASAFVGDGSNITGVISSSYAQTASYIDGFVNFDQGIVVTGSLIASGGLSGIGEPSPSYDWDVNGTVRADTYYWDTAAPQQTPSDSRLKTKVTPLSPQSDRIRDVNLVEFEWSELNDTRPSRQNRTKRQGTKDVGVIAQELQEIFPELVSEDVDGYLTVSYVGLLIPLIKTVQEQQKQIDELKKLISDR